MMKIKSKITIKIITLLPKWFVIEFNEWDNNYGEHLIGINALFYDESNDNNNNNNINNNNNTNNKNKAKRVLLALQTLCLHEGHNSKNILVTIVDILNSFGKSLNNIICFVGDNYNVNKCIANITKTDKYDHIGIPLVGCRAHLLNLFVKTEFL